jgi:hypothetical protein
MYKRQARLYTTQAHNTAGTCRKDTSHGSLRSCRHSCTRGTQQRQRHFEGWLLYMYARNPTVLLQHCPRHAVAQTPSHPERPTQQYCTSFGGSSDHDCLHKPHNSTRHRGVAPHQSACPVQKHTIAGANAPDMLLATYTTQDAGHAIAPRGPSCFPHTQLARTVSVLSACAAATSHLLQ